MEYVIVDTEHKRKWFNCCSANSGYWKWFKVGETSGESKNVCSTSTKPLANKLDEDIFGVFQTMCHLSHEKDVDISVNYVKEMLLRRGIRSEKCGPTFVVVDVFA
ncbi:uncharacterized protein LOC111401717 [Olea europaea var. sylvestris]|uniref:uncharacterized protein LOC111401717 n=1 Tax=Olea europaea var. sylvestris TaxID=158386 RepID=UPI000C1CF769|nr:uncharacterized protein LOC111401717 [Olea europaea var. sylvestris]XP_022885343.1 uncharacterized protein LOC111401717 [Olea europaea var. sylvestris]XP_022885344.1 uncharacterized protein LOC111401717 [Olea europaea var. sylvestris]